MILRISGFATSAWLFGFLTITAELSLAFSEPRQEAPAPAEKGRVIQELFAGELAFPQNRNELQATLGTNFGSHLGVKFNSSDLSIEYGARDDFQIATDWTFDMRFGEPIAYGWEGEVNMLCRVINLPSTGFVGSFALGAGYGSDKLLITSTVMFNQILGSASFNFSTKLELHPLVEESQLAPELALSVFATKGKFVPIGELLFGLEDNNASVSTIAGIHFIANEYFGAAAGLKIGITSSKPSASAFMLVYSEFDFGEL